MNTFSDPQAIVEQLPIYQGQSVADFGAGPGAYTFLLAKKVGEGKVYGIEVQKNMVEQLGTEAENRGLTNVHPVWGDLESPHGSRLRDESVQAVIIANILFQAEHPNKVIQEAYRVLAKDGVLILIDWSESFGNIGPKESHVISESAARLLVEEHHFTIENTLRAGEHHYGFVARKQV